MQVSTFVIFGPFPISLYELVTVRTHQRGFAENDIFSWAVLDASTNMPVPPFQSKEFSRNRYLKRHATILVRVA